MKFKVGDRVKIGNVKGSIIQIYYHKVMVWMYPKYGVFILNKKDVELIKCKTF